MSVINTLEEYKRLIDSGISEKQAYAQIQSTFSILSNNMDNLATKTELKQEIYDLKMDFKLDLQEIKNSFNLLHKDFLYNRAAIGVLIAVIVLPHVSGLINMFK